MSMKKNYIHLMQELCYFSKLCYSRNLAGGSGGNLSVRIRGTETFIVTASGVALRDVSEENLLLVDKEGRILDGNPELKPSKEIGFHLGIYSVRHDTDAVIHVHPVSAVVQSSFRELIPLVTISAKLKLRQGPLVDEAPPGSEELKNNVIEAVSRAKLEDSILLLENHGIVAFSGNLEDAFNAAELAADTAEIALRERSLRRNTGLNLEAFNIVDFTAPLNKSVQTYPSDPPFKKSKYSDFAETGSRVSMIEMGSHTGTHVDAPFHFIKEGEDIGSMPLSRFTGSACIVNTPKKPGEDITIEDVRNKGIRPADIILFRTGWEERANTPSFFQDEWPGFGEDLIDYLAEKKIKGIGGDIPSADSPGAIKRGAPAHKKILSLGIPIFEALVNLRNYTGRRFIFFGFPLRIDEGDGSPIRAVGLF